MRFDERYLIPASAQYGAGHFRHCFIVRPRGANVGRSRYAQYTSIQDWDSRAKIDKSTGYLSSLDGVDPCFHGDGPFAHRHEGLNWKLLSSIRCCCRIETPMQHADTRFSPHLQTCIHVRFDQGDHEGLLRPCSSYTSLGQSAKIFSNLD